jgi:hypothetical protein
MKNDQSKLNYVTVIGFIDDRDVSYTGLCSEDEAVKNFNDIFEGAKITKINIKSQEEKIKYSFDNLKKFNNKNMDYLEDYLED